ncbi:aldo/keto reductase, partial [Myxococcota bacterium]|nr:aldo/keto reductase [Myxococcota bacterium]
MKYRPLGRTGLRVSELSFGSMTFANYTNAIQKVDLSLANEMVARCLDAGINLFDTADVYGGGDSDLLLGRALGTRRADVVIATKVGSPSGRQPNQAGLSYRRVVESVEGSLRRLGTDWIDVLQIHRRDAHTPFEETARAFDDLTRRGLVRYTGFSNLTAWEAAKYHAHQQARGHAAFCVAQMYYSLVGRDIEHDVVPFLESEGLALLVWSPLAAGFLTGKYTREQYGGDGDRRAGFDFPHVDPELGFPVVDALVEIADAHGAKPAQIALAWLLTRPFVTSVILGATSLGQLD